MSAFVPLLGENPTSVATNFMSTHPSHMESKFAALKEKVLLQVQVIQIDQIRRLILAFSNAFSAKHGRH
jgi:hypothetical protein